MNDKEFRGKLDTQRVEHVKLVRERNSYAERLKAKFDAARRKLNTDDPAKVKAELEKDPEWKELYAKCTNAAARVEANHLGTLGIVRERITPKAPAGAAPRGAERPAGEKLPVKEISK